MSEPLSREQRAELAKGACSGMSGMTAEAVQRLTDRYEATVQALEERVERLRGVKTTPGCCEQCDAIIAALADDEASR